MFATWAHARVRGVAVGLVSTVALVGLGGVGLRLGYEANRCRWQAAKEAQAPAGPAAEPLFRRRSSQSLAWLLSQRVHLLVVGTTGCGKTSAVLESCRLPASASGAVLLPFYVNLEQVIASGGAGDAQDDVCKRTVAAFASASRAFESQLLRLLSEDFKAWAWVRLSNLLPDGLSPGSLAALKRVTSPLPKEHEASLYGLLTHLADVGSQQAALRVYARGLTDGFPLVPVIIIDEVHLLRDADLEPVLRDLLRFVQEHVHAKRTAAVTIVLLSSDAYAAETVSNCACPLCTLRPSFHSLFSHATCANAGGRVSRRLRTMRLGDLQDAELRPFLSFLAGAMASKPAAERFCKLWESEEQFKALRQRYGGYVSDLVALRDAHAELVTAADGANESVSKETSEGASEGASEGVKEGTDEGAAEVTSITPGACSSRGISELFC